MPDRDLQKRVESLEVRLMHLEAALDEVTHTLLTQETQLNTQADTIRRLEALVRGLADSGPAGPLQEPPPPHY